MKTVASWYLVGSMIMAPGVCAQAPWFESERRLDLTGDGRPETIRVQAHGTRPESLAVEMTITSAGRELYRVEWNSVLYFFYDEPVSEIPGDVVLSQVNSQFARLLAESAFEPFTTLDYPTAWVPTVPDSDDPRDRIAWTLKAEPARRRLTDSLGTEPSSVQLARYRWTFPVDTAAVNRVWRDMAGLDLVSFTFFSGGEHLRKIVWSPMRQEFMVVWSCC